MKMNAEKEIVSYNYSVGGFGLATREAARIVQRSLRGAGESKALTKIVQTMTVKRVVR